MKSSGKKRNILLIRIVIGKSQGNIARSRVQRQRTEDLAIGREAVQIDIKIDVSDTPVHHRLPIRLEVAAAQKIPEVRRHHRVEKMLRQKHPERRKRKTVSLFDCS